MLHPRRSPVKILLRLRPEHHIVSLQVFNSVFWISSNNVNSYLQRSNLVFLLLSRVSPAASCYTVAVCLIRALFLALVFTHTALGDLLPSSDCIILSAVGCKKRESEALSCHKAVLYHHFISHLQSYSSSQLTEALLCPSEGEAGSFTPSSSSSACLSLMITVSQQVLHFFFLFPPSFAYLHSSPSRLPPSLNKSPASKG